MDTTASFPALEIDDGTNPPRLVTLVGDVTRVGRAGDNEVQIADPRVSKYHLEVRREAGRFLAVDAGSKAGVYVNGAPTARWELSNGDALTLGPRTTPRIVFRTAAETSKPDSRTSMILRLTETKGRDGLEKLSRFLELSRLFHGGFDHEELLENVVDLAIEITGAERGFLIDTPRGGELRFRVARGQGNARIPRKGARVSETIVERVLEDKKPCIVSDVSAQEGLAKAKSVLSLELRSAAAVPLWRFALAEEGHDDARPTDEVFGVLYLDCKGHRVAFDKLDVSLLETLARDASSVIENARLLREAEDKARLEREVRTARAVQASLLPDTFAGVPHADVHGSSIPCLELGGDYLGEFRLPGEVLAFAVADVAGKGIPASLLAATLQGALTVELESTSDLAHVAVAMNRTVRRVAPEGMFITLECCTLTPEGELAWVDAGHRYGLLVRGGRVERLEGKGAALGFAPPDEPYEVAHTRLERGDVVALFTDGVVECRNTSGELLGGDRIEAVLTSTHERTAEEIVGAVLHTVRHFRGELPVADDVTVMVVKYSGL